MELLCVSVCKS